MGCSNYNLLPEEINLDILSRLSCETVLECKRVCKKWQTLLLNPCFQRMHLRRRKLLQLDDDLDEQGNDDYYYKFSNVSKMSFLFGCSSEYIYGEYDVTDEQNFNKAITRSKPIPKTIGGMYLGSCDGLVLSEPLNFSKTDPVTKARCDSLVVSNPMTGEYVNLPSFREPIDSTVFGFGYDSSTRSYKVVRISYISNPEPVDVGQIYIYTLGRRSSGWRHAGIINCYLKRDHGVLANGALHWLERNNSRIFAFGLADEKFREFAAPPGLDYRNTGTTGSKFILRFMGGWLCLQYNNFDYPITDIWALKKKTTENFRRGRHGIAEKNESWNWTREFCISTSPTASFLPLDVTKNGELLLLRSDCSITEEEFPEPTNWNGDLNSAAVSLLKYYYQSLVRYDRKTKALERICDTAVHLQAKASFVKSLISLKDLGEEDAKRM